MKGMRIIAAGSALPEKVVTNDDLSRIVETDDEWIRVRTGIKSRRLSEKETCVSLAAAAAKKAIASAGISPEKIGAVITATSTPDYIFPSVSCLVQRELGLDEEVTAFDVSAACTGFLCGLQVCSGLIGDPARPYVLLIGSEQMSRLVDYTDRSTCILFGDGAGAVILAPGNEPCILKSWSRGNAEVLSCVGPGKGEGYIQMKGREVFRFAVTALAQAVDETLLKAGKTPDDVDYVVCHQANARIIDHVKKKYPSCSHKFFTNIEELGNTSAASIPIALDELIRENAQKKLRLLCVGFGAGLVWSGAWLEYNVEDKV